MSQKSMTSVKDVPMKDGCHLCFSPAQQNRGLEFKIKLQYCFNTCICELSFICLMLIKYFMYCVCGVNSFDLEKHPVLELNPLSFLLIDSSRFFLNLILLSKIHAAMLDLSLPTRLIKHSFNSIIRTQDTNTHTNLLISFNN